MQGLPDLRDRVARRYRMMAICAAIALAIILALLVSDFPHPLRRTITLSMLSLGGLIAVVGFRDRIRISVGRPRLSYYCFATALLLASVSNFLSILFPRSGNPSQIVPGDIGTILALTVGSAGLFLFPAARRRATDLTRMALDGIVLGGSILLVAAVTLFPDLAMNNPGRWPILATPVIDVVIATLAVLLFLRGNRDRLLLGLTAAGFFCFALSDFAFAFISGSPKVFDYGSIFDVGWLSGYLLLALAVWTPPRLAPPGDQALVERSPLVGTIIMFTLFITAVTISLVSLVSGEVTLTTVGLLLLVLLAVLARQVLLVIDNDQLRRGLEQRVVERTRSLRQATQRTDLLVNAVGEGIYGVDRDGVITFVNPASADALGYGAAELIGRDAHTTFHAPDEEGAAFPEEDCYITQAIRDGRVSSAEEDTYVRSDGRRVPVEVTTTPLAEDGTAVGAVVIFRDVTQRREVDRLKTEFVSMVSHELRTPLTAIQGSLGLISGGALGPLPPAAGRMLEIASISSKRLHRLINDILDVERIESGILVLEPGDHTALSLVEAAIAQVQVLASEARVSVVLGRLDGVVHADADRAVQTLINLLGNATKFSFPGGTVTVASRVEGSFVKFDVHDEGRGIPEDRLDRIFRRFEQVDSSDAREKGGFGLGLAISQSIVERSGGRIWATNNPEGGATFHVTLPLSGTNLAEESGSDPVAADEDQQDSDRVRATA